VSPRDGLPHRLGLLGCGSFGAFLADAIAGTPTAELAAVADSRKDLAVRLAAAHPSAAIESGLDGLLADRDVDVVVIATPPWTHATLAVQALRAGRHVLVEKPLAIDLDGCRHIAEAAFETGRTVGVDHLLRFAPLVTVLDRLLAVEVAGRRVLGPIRRFAFENDAADEDLPPDHWFWDTRRSGGIFIEHGVHFFDLAANLIGSPVAAIQALAGTRADGRTNTVCATARYQGGATASWYHSFTHPRHGERQSLRLDLGNGECRLAGWIPLKMQLEAWTNRAAAEALRRAATDIDDLGVPERDIAVTAAAAPELATAAARGATHHVRIRLGHGPNAKQTVYATCIRKLLTDFFTAVDQARPPRVDIDAATAAVAVAAAATEATRTGRTLTPTRSEHSSAEERGTR
jgi:predicted dehydrogenase